MLLGEPFQKFVDRSPVAVMVDGIIERMFDPDRLEDLFRANAVLQYTRELTFAQCVHVMSDVVFKKSSGVGAWYKTHPGEVPVTRQALYDKLKHTDLPVPVALVQYSGRESLACLSAMVLRPRSPLAGSRVRVLDGNNLGGTEHRLAELRPYRAAALPGQAMCLTDPSTDETLLVRRITIELLTPTKRGETEIHLLTTVPAEDADALKIGELYWDRWTIEKAFWHLSEDLQLEIDTLGYPKAALFGFCVALTAYNMVSRVKGAVAAVWGHSFVKDELSMYYLAMEVEKVTAGMQIAVGREDWSIFRTMTTSQFAQTLRAMAEHMDLRKYTQSKRGPKKKPPKKISGRQRPHVSTARLLEMRARK
jgi:hypothetical protein